MTCPEARELFSALADEALPAAERAALDTHLAGCTECRRDWSRFRATIGLLQSVEPARAPAGFVDRVLDRARPRPWYRRLVRDVFLPLPRKLPLEAAALLLVGGLAVWMFQRTPEQQQAARFEAERPAVTETTPAPRPGEQPGVTLSLERRADEPAAPAVPAPSAPTPAAPASEPAPPAPPPAAPAPAPRPRLSSAARDERTAAATASAPATAPAPAPGRKSAEMENKTGIALGDSAETSPAPRAGAPPAGAPARQDARAKAAPEASSTLQAAQAPVPPIAARLAVADAAAALRELAPLVARLGGSQTARRPDGTATVVDLVVPGPAYGELRRELSRLGTFEAEREPANAEQPVALRLSIASAPR